MKNKNNYSNFIMVHMTNRIKIIEKQNKKYVTFLKV